VDTPDSGSGAPGLAGAPRLFERHRRVGGAAPDPRARRPHQL